VRKTPNRPARLSSAVHSSFVFMGDSPGTFAAAVVVLFGEEFWCCFPHGLARDRQIAGKCS